MKKSTIKPCGATPEVISNLAERVGTTLGFKPGDPLEPIIERLRGTIKYFPLAGAGSRQASITVERGGKFTLRLSAAIFPLQKRVSMAHELGHLFLHSRYGEVEFEAFHDVESENEQAESEAREFAYAFLMPTNELRQVMQDVGDDSTAVAAFFMVPEPIARQRMQDVANR